MEPVYFALEVLETLEFCEFNLIRFQGGVFYDGRMCTIYGGWNDVTIEKLGWQALRWDTLYAICGLEGVCKT